MSKPTIEAGHFHEVYLLNEQPAAYYRTIADRNRKLLAEATTPRLKQYLGEMIERSERLAEEVESVSEKD